MKQTLFFLVILFLYACLDNQQATSFDAELENDVDSLVHAYLDSAKIAGLAIGVYKNGEPLLHKSYGYADLEFNVKLPINASFPIGSITKQFTAVAILQLAEQKKLHLEDDVTKYIRFNTQGRKITIRHLLSHTSGIKSYSDYSWMSVIRRLDLPRDTLLRILEKKSFDFEPGQALIYNSTGFMMLGLIIEKISGLSYEDYVTRNLFSVAGMTNSYYCSVSKIVKDRAHGYEFGEAGLIRSEHPNYAWPYAAGSLCSTAEDITKWNRSLHQGKILGNDMYRELIAKTRLLDGTTTSYAKGLAVIVYNGQEMIEHPGDIDGYMSESRYFPKDDLSIVVLINTIGPLSPVEVANFISDHFYPTILQNDTKFTGDISNLIGTYEGRGRATDLEVNIIESNGGLLVKIGNAPPTALKYERDTTWSGNNFSSYKFKVKNGTDDELRIDRIYGYYILKRANKTSEEMSH